MAQCFVSNAPQTKNGSLGTRNDHQPFGFSKVLIQQRQNASHEGALPDRSLGKQRSSIRNKLQESIEVASAYSSIEQL